MRTIIVVACGLLLLAVSRVMGNETQQPIRFNEHIRPLLAENCLGCHGPDSASREADLRLDLREEALGSGVIVPGDADQSELVMRITTDDPELMMPPPGSSKRLTADDQRVLIEWIDAGAEYQRHWAFIRPRKAAPPQPPGVETWAQNPIDHFVFAALHEHGLRPNEAADRHTLARRAALDLTGLPPDKTLLENYLAKQGGDYSGYLDSLLASPHAGEHRARFWLDAARYGDTHGMHVDNYREIWPYRDWVIRAFNANMPFDQFVIEQIAGDLIAGATLEQQIATGFNRCNITTSEGGAISAEVNVRYMVDRVETMATVFLGLTAGCAVCHDHKYDPISQREFYRLGAFFNNTTQPAMDGNQRDTPPVVTLPGPEFQNEWQQLLERRRSLRAQLSQREWAEERDWVARERQREHPIAADSLLLWMPLNEEESDSIQLPAGASWATDHPAGERGIRFGERSEITVDFPTLRSDEPLTVSFWFRTPDRVINTTLFDQTMKIEEEADAENEAEGKRKEKTVGWRINSGVRSELTFELFDMDGGRIRALLPDNDALTPRTWQHVCVRYSGGQSQSSVTILVNGRTIAIRHGSEALVSATELATAPLKIASNLPTAGLSDVRIYGRWINDREAQLLAQDHQLRELLRSRVSWEELSDSSRELFREHQLEVDERYRECARELALTQLRRDFIYARSTTTLVMQERASQPRAWVLERGEYDRRQEEVTPGVPAVLPPLEEGISPNRMGLARWLVHPAHPLTARVMVNRLWQSVFGVGLVKTSEDFGVMGDSPSHADLLDWLAVEFVESGWDVNHMLKLMTTSATYQQSGVVTPEKLAADPENRLISRGPRLRLDAEVLRDQALVVSGLLRRQVGGPSVRPYQPAGLWNVVAIPGSNTSKFKQDSGDSLYRRSLYTFWKRTSPPPSMAAFNAPTREQCTVRRERTNTPLQALVLMNDPQYVEAARAFAERALRQHEQAEQRVSWMLTTALVRPPAKADVDTLAEAAAEFQEIFERDTEGAGKLVKTGDSAPDPTLELTELAAWTLVANAIMNRDDFINK